MFGVEHFQVIKGGVNMLTFTLFMSSLEKKIIPKLKNLLIDEAFHHEDIVYLYDNASSHVGGLI